MPLFLLCVLCVPTLHHLTRAGLPQGMTVENFGKDVTSLSDEDLSKVNLSTPDANSNSH